MTVPFAPTPQQEPVSWSPRRVAIVGAGLLGGSFALAIRGRYREATLIGVSRSQRSRDAAVRCGAVHEAVEDAKEACRQADLVVLATPVDRIASLAITAASVCSEDALITDLGSTKASIVVAVHKHPLAARMFVGSHPIAGSEKTGAQHARAELFASRPVVLTPIDQSDPCRVRRASELWQSIGARVVVMTPEDHDRVMALISHVPHLVASALANLLDAPCKGLVGNGWLDITRVASGDPEMWTAICQENRAAIIAGLEDVSAKLQQFRDAMIAGDDRRLYELLQDAKQTRDTAAAETGAERA